MSALQNEVDKLGNDVKRVTGKGEGVNERGGKWEGGAGSFVLDQFGFS